MNRVVFRWMMISGALLAPAASFAADVSCTRDGLKAALAWRDARFPGYSSRPVLAA